ncbi:MAG: QueT transporter family protein [Ruthenibacterium sp.]
MKTKQIVRCALIAALYAAISLALAPITYGPMQARVSEALTLLPIFTPDAVIGVTLGCFLTNLVGVFTGANILGVLDILFGTAATCIAALATRKLAKNRLAGLPLVAALPPVFINAIVVGAELTWLLGPHTWPMFLAQAGWVALGQILSCYMLGIPLVKLIEKTPALKHWFTE